MTWTRQVAVRAVAEVALGRQRSPQHDNGPHMVKYLRAANVKDGELDLSDVKRMNFTPAEQAIFSLRPGDVLVTEGSGSLSAVGASAVWPGGEEDDVFCFQNTLLRLRPRPGVVLGEFLAWWARSAYSSGIFASLAGGANIYHLSAERLRSLRIDVPPVGEQRRIVEFLDSEVARMGAISKRRGQVSKLARHRHQVLVDVELERLVEEFGVRSFRRSIVNVEQGFSPLCENSPAPEGEWGVLKVSSVKLGVFNEKESKRYPEGDASMSRYEVKEGDLLITRANTPSLVGSVALVPRVREKLLISDKIFRLKTSGNIDPRFLVFAAGGSRIRGMCAMASHGTSQSMVNLKSEEIKAWPIPAAPLDEQARAAAKFEESRVFTDRLRELANRQIQLLEERKRALITAAVTGQIDVNTARGADVS